MIRSIPARQQYNPSFEKDLVMFWCMLMKDFFPVTLGFVETSYSVTENVNATISVCVGVMSGAINETVVVTVSTNDGTAGKVGAGLTSVYVGVSHSLLHFSEWDRLWLYSYESDLY